MRVLLGAVALLIGVDAFGVHRQAFGTTSTTKLDMGVKNPPPNDATAGKPLAFLGAAGASLGLVIFAPFAGLESSGSVPTSSTPEIVKIVQKKEKALPDAKATLVFKEKAPAAPKVAKSNSFKDQGYNFDGDAPVVKVTVPKVEAKADAGAAARNAAQEKASAAKAESATKAAEAKASAVHTLASEKSAAKEAKAALAAEKAAGEKEAAAKQKAEAAAAKAAVAEKAAPTKKVDTAVADKAAADTSAKTKQAEEAALKKAAAEKGVAEKVAAEKAAVEKIAADKAAAEKAIADKAATDKATAEKVTPKPAPAPKPATVVAGSGVGIVTGKESGGKVLPKEEISADVLSMLKKYN